MESINVMNACLTAYATWESRLYIVRSAITWSPSARGQQEPLPGDNTVPYVSYVFQRH